MPVETYSNSYKVVTHGGGTGHFVLVNDLKNFFNPSLITCVPPSSDRGGSSGKIVSEFGVLPPGDARQCLVALAPEKIQIDVANQLNFRFPENNGNHLKEEVREQIRELGGVNVGNVNLAALELQYHSLEAALSVFQRMLNIPGHVVPVSNSRVDIIAVLDSGKVIKGENYIDTRAKDKDFDPNDKIARLYIEEESYLNPNVGHAMDDADILITAPGDLYTSKLPHWLIRGWTNAWHSSKALKVYCSELMIKRGETDGMTSADCLERFISYMEEPDIDLVILNDEELIPDNVVKIYEHFGQKPMKADFDNCRKLLPKARIVKYELAKPVYPRIYNPNRPGLILRHNGLLLAEKIKENYKALKESD